MKVGYSDFISLCRVDNKESWDEKLSVRGDGVYVKIPPKEATCLEHAELSSHPTGNLNEPALQFPCSLRELQVFLEDSGNYGCIDAFDMAEWVIKKKQDAGSPTGSNPNRSDKLAILTQAATVFWANAARDDQCTHPKNADVVAWLVKHHFSPALADKAATIIRPVWAASGRRREE